MAAISGYPKPLPATLQRTENLPALLVSETSAFAALVFRYTRHNDIAVAISGLGHPDMQPVCVSISEETTLAELHRQVDAALSDVKRVLQASTKQ